jgi:hypothetical protein
MPIQKQKMAPPWGEGSGDKGPLKKIKRSGASQDLLNRLDEAIEESQQEQEPEQEYRGCGC